MSQKRIVIFSILLLTLGLVVFLSIQHVKLKVTVEKDVMHLLNAQEFGDYRLTEDFNKMTCDLVTFSCLVHRMQMDGYVIEDATESTKFIEVYLSKGEIAIRLRYDNGGNFMSVCKIYEKSYIPLTYLTEDK